MDNKSIILKGIKVNNLKNIDVEIPSNQLVVVTGLSGSGKSSLVFDAIYAEGQRRYVESLNAYARQFFGKINKPSIEFVQGIPPAIAIEQRIVSRNPRSTLGTVTEIYEYMKLLYARLGETFSPVSGNAVKRDSVSDVVDYILSLPQETKIMILVPIIADENRDIFHKLLIFQEKGFSRAYWEDKIYKISDLLEEKTIKRKPVFLLVDRCTASQDEENKSRLSDSVQAAYLEGDERCGILSFGENDAKTYKEFSNRFEADGVVFRKPCVNMFSFSNSYGACPECNGVGSGVGIDPDLVIPDKTLSVFDNAVACWKGEEMGKFKDELIKNAYKFNFPIYKPVLELSKEEYDLLWAGNSYFSGINGFVKWLESNEHKIQYKALLSRYRGKATCPHCNGSRLCQDAEYVKIGGNSISQVCALSVEKALQFFTSLTFDEPSKQKIAVPLLREITTRLGFLNYLGLSYLTINRPSASLSGGEYQRVTLSTTLGNSLVGSLYILDEPSIGLHTVDTHKLINLLRHLRDIGNTVLVVEHDEDIIKAADYVIDVGPFAGRLGGEIVFAGEFKELSKDKKSITAQYITGKQHIPLPEKRKSFLYNIQLQGATLNNLKGVNATFPIGGITAVTGVSGSGKSTLVTKALYEELRKYFDSYQGYKLQNSLLSGDLHLLKEVELIDQNPIGRMSRSNPATYTGMYSNIRELFAEQPLSIKRRYKPGFFSLNVEGGRCETCQGEGFITIEMQFMPDVKILCDECQGKRFKDEVFDIQINKKTIADVLDMTVDEAIDYFSYSVKSRYISTILSSLQALQSVGLGYIQLGQSSSSLSGGEAQRVKLTTFLLRAGHYKSMLFIFDEPTTGLHLHDIKKLYQAFQLLIERGHTIIVIEHNLELIKCADWIIELGPEGGDRGGNIVYSGTPEGLLKCKKSPTARFLKNKLHTN